MPDQNNPFMDMVRAAMAPKPKAKKSLARKPNPDEDAVNDPVLKAIVPSESGRRKIVRRRLHPTKEEVRQDEEDTRSQLIQQARATGQKVTLPDGSIYYPEGSDVTIGDFDPSEAQQTNISRAWATNFGRTPEAMDGLGMSSGAIGAKREKARNAALGRPFTSVRKGLAAAMDAVSGGSSKPATDILSDLDQKIKNYDGEHGAEGSFDETMHQKGEGVKAALDDALGAWKSAGLGVGPALQTVSHWVADPVIDTMYGSGMGVLRGDVSPFQRTKDAFNVAMTSAMAVAPTAEVAGGALSKLGATAGGALLKGVGETALGADITLPAINRGLHLAGDVAAPAIDAVKGIASSARTSVQDGLLAAGLNRPIFNQAAGAAYDAVKGGLEEAGVNRSTAGAYGGVAGSRAAKLGSADWVPDIVKGETEGRGRIEFGDNGSTITLGPRADATTPGHELFHAIRRTLTPLEQRVFEHGLGVENGVWTRDAEEGFAHLGEHYLKTGEAPTPGLQTAFDHLSREFEKVYGKSPHIDSVAGGAFLRLFKAPPKGVKGFLYDKAVQAFEAGAKNSGAKPDELSVLDQSDDKDLIALHNTSVEGIGKAIDLGGIPQPSMAVLRKGMPFDSFGNATLVGKRGIVDPAEHYQNNLFNRDIYSQRQPLPAHDFDRKGLDKAFGDLSMQFMGTRYGGSDIHYQIANYFKKDEGNITRLAREMSNSDTVRAMYLHEKGIKFEPSREGIRDAWFELRGADDKYSRTEEIANEIIKPFLKEPSVKVGSKWVPYTAENVNRAMGTRVVGREKTLTASSGKQAAKAAKQFSNLDQARGAKASIISKDEMEAYKKRGESLWDEFLNGVTTDAPSGGRFETLDDLSNAIGDVAKKANPTIEDLEASIRRNSFHKVNVSDDSLQAGLDYAKHLRAAPTEYFEGKPTRVVKMSEFAGAVVPHGTSADALSKLESAGLKVHTYDPAVPGSREAAIQKLHGEPDVLFQPNLPTVEDPRLDPYADEYDPHYSAVIAKAFGDGSSDQAMHNLAEFEDRVAEAARNIETHQADHEANIQGLTEAHQFHSDKLDRLNELHRAVLGLGKKTAADARANRATGSASPFEDAVVMRKNRSGKWVPLPGTMAFNGIDVDILRENPDLLERLKQAVSSLDEGYQFVPRDVFNRLYVKGSPPSSLRDYNSLGRLSEMMFRENSESEILHGASSGTVHGITVPQRAIDKVKAEINSEYRVAAKSAERYDGEIKTATRDFEKEHKNLTQEHKRIVDEGAKRVRDAERAMSGPGSAGDSFGERLATLKAKRQAPTTKAVPTGVKAFSPSRGDKFRNAFVENLSGLKKADLDAYVAARALGASSPEANVILKQAATQVDHAGGNGSFEALIPKLTSSRLIGIYDRWARMAEEFRNMDPWDIVSKINDGSFDPILENVENGKHLRAAAKDAMKLKPGEIVVTPEGERGVLLEQRTKKGGFIIQTNNGDRIVTDKTPQPIKLEKELGRIRDAMATTAEDARQNVGLLIAGGGQRDVRFDPITHDPVDIRSIVEHEREQLLKYREGNQHVLDAYNEHFVPAVTEIHERNQGFNTKDLGPLDTYVPLMPKSKGEAEVVPLSGREKLMFNRPDNPRNQFATGLATDYDMTVQGLGDALKDTVRTNNKARLMDKLRDAGLLVDDVKRAADHEGPVVRKDADGVWIDYPDGGSVPAVMVPTSYAKYIEGDLGLAKKEAKQAAIPDWLYRELKPAFEQGGTGLLEENIAPVLRAINAYGMAGPADAFFHSVNVLNVLRSGTPFTATTKLGRLWEGTPVLGTSTRWMTSLYRLMRTDALDEAAAADLREMAQYGALPNRYGHETYSPELAATTGAELKGFKAPLVKGEGGKALVKSVGDKISFGPVLNGPAGLDARARLIMWRTAKEIMPEAHPVDWADFTNQLGAYNNLLASELERTVKGAGIAPFYTAGSTMLRNGVRTWTDGVRGASMIKTRLGKPDRGALWAAQQLGGGATGALITWAVLHKGLTGKFPWQVKDSQLFEIPIPNEVAGVDLKPFKRKVWGSSSAKARMNMAFFLGLPERGARALGVKGYYDTKSLGGTRGQAEEAAFAGQINSLLHPITSSPVVRTAFDAMGAEPHITSFRGPRGEYGPPQLLSHTPSVSEGVGQISSNIGLAAMDSNQLVGGIVRALGKLTHHGKDWVPEPDWLRKSNEGKTALATVLAYTFPRLFNPPKDLERKKAALKAQNRMVERKIERDSGEEAPAKSKGLGGGLGGGIGGGLKKGLGRGL